MQLKVFYITERTLAAETDVLGLLHSPWGMPTIRPTRKKCPDIIPA